jgi:putative tryptophan/tyrosine transport system substrate-binding protein
MHRQGRRHFLQGSLALAGLGLLTGCGMVPPLAQQPAKVPRLGLLTTRAVGSRNLDAFYQGLRELGYVEGQTITIEYRLADQNAQLGELAAELVRLTPDVILAAIGPAAEATKRITTTIPIVMASSANAVEVGLVASLAQPGGNVTGLTVDSAGVVSKQLDLIKETVPGLVRLAVFWNPSNLATAPALRANEGVARALGLQLYPFEVRGLQDLPAAFAGVTNSRAEALAVIAGVQGDLLDPAMADFTRQARLPSMFPFRDAVVAGGLMAYTTDLTAMAHRAATYVDKILKGAKPADLPVERSDRFQLVVNLHTAQALGLTIPQSVLIQATEIIQAG